MPWFSTYHYQASPGVVAKNNPTSDNWYFNKSIQIYTNLNDLFANIGSVGKINVFDVKRESMPFLEKCWYSTKFLANCVPEITYTMLEEGYYIAFNGVDDFYVNGKSWYKEKHFNHDGLICGIDNKSKEFLIAAYDQNWTYRTFRTPQTSFVKGMKAILDKNECGGFVALKCLPSVLEVNISEIKQGLLSYLSVQVEPNEKNEVFGIKVFLYIINYLNQLKTGEIPYERIDRRIFRLIWEHKNCMLSRLKAVESHCDLSDVISNEYKTVLETANKIRYAYMKHCKKRNDALLDSIIENLSETTEKEITLLEAFCVKI